MYMGGVSHPFHSQALTVKTHLGNVGVRRLPHFRSLKGKASVLDVDFQSAFLSKPFRRGKESGDSLSLLPPASWQALD